MIQLTFLNRRNLKSLLGLTGCGLMFLSSIQAQTTERPLIAYVGTFSSPLGDVLPTQVDLPPGNGRGIHIFQVNRESGALSPSGEFLSGTSPSCLAVDAGGTRIYYTNETDKMADGKSGSVSAYAVYPATGGLTLLNTVSSGGAGPTFASIHPSGKFLLVANYFGGSVAVLPIKPDGSLGEATDVKKDEGEIGPERATHAPPGSFAFSGHDIPHAHMIQTDPAGRFVLHVNLGLDKIFVSEFDEATGKLSPNDPASVSLPPGDGPRHFAFHPNGNWLYSLQEEGPTIVLFDYDSAKGTLASRQTISSLPPGYAGSSFSSEIMVSADGRFVYAGNRLHDGISIFSVGEKGELTYVDDEWTRGNYPRNFNFDPTGNFLYSCNQRADNLATFRVDKETGKLDFTGQYTPVGNPSVIVFVDLAQVVTEDGRWALGEVKGGEETVLPKLGRNITAAYFTNDPERKPLTVGFNEDATKVTLQVPEGAGGPVTLEVADNTTQFPDGRIVLSALDARVEGDRAKLETHPGNHRIGYWSNIADSVHWDYKATRHGMYDVELTYSVANGEGNEIECSFGSETLTGKLVDTGSWYLYTTVPVGRVYIDKAGALPVKVRGVKMKGGAVMNLKAITLRPAPEGKEGKEIKQAEDGSVELDAHDATVHGVTMQYERKPQKMCLGYWVNPNDWASWTFPIEKPGTFKVELTQGCGAGHGGSEVSLLVGGKSFDFTVEDTGGFQNWKAREIGEVTLEEPGEYRLEVRPKNKAKVAVMDIRRVRLVPVQ